MLVGKIRRGLIILGGAMLLCAVIAIVAQTVFKSPPLSIPTSGGMNRFVSTTGHFAISYPVGWSIREFPNGLQGDKTIVALIDYSKLPPPGVRVTLRSGTPVGSLNQVAEWVEAYRRVLPSYRVISQDERTLNSDLVKEQVSVDEMPATPLQPAQPIKCLAHYRLHGQVGYALLFCSQAADYPGLEPTFRQMINSLTYQE